MHVSDGILAPAVWLPLDVIGGIAVAGAGWRLNKRLDDKQVPLLGTCGAFVFAAQMLNFKVGPGVSGHFVGGALVGFLLGPASAVVVLTSVLLIQCFVFGDGGITTLGANVVNMGLLGGAQGAIAGSLARRLGMKPGAPPSRRVIAGIGFAAGFLSCVLSSLACGLELAASGISAAIVPTLVATHAAIGVGEGLITAAALSVLLAARPDLLELERV